MNTNRQKPTYLMACLLLFASALSYGIGSKQKDLIMKSRTNGLVLEQRIVYLDSAIAMCQGSGDFTRFDIIVEKAELHFKNAQYYFVAQLTSNALKSLDAMKDTAQSEHFKKIHSDILFWYGYSLAHMSRYDEAARQFYQISKLYGEEEYSVYSSKAYRGLGMVNGMCSKQAKAKEYFLKCLDISKRVNDYESICGILSNIGVLYLQKHQSDSALIFLLEANKVAVQHRGRCDEARVLYLMGAAYCFLGQVKLGNEYLLNAIPVAESKGDYRLVLFIRNCILHNLIISGNDVKAKKECFLHYEMAKKYGAKDLEADALLVLSGIYEREGDDKKAYYYLKLYQVKNDSIFSKESEERLEAQNMDFENYKLEQAKEMMQKDVQLSKVTVEKRNLWIAVLLGTVALISGLLIWLLRRMIIQCKVNKLLHKKIVNLHEQENICFESVQKRLEEELDHKNKELMLNLLFQVNVKDTLSEVLDRLHLLKRSFSSVGKDSIVIGEMENLLRGLDVDKDRSMFQLYFEQVNDSFFQELLKAYPNLTLGERRLCALISLNLTTKEIASLINRSVRGVETAKFRLRKKMQLAPNDNLTDLLVRIKNGENLLPLPAF